MDAELVKWGIQQGALAVVCILLIVYIRKRDEEIKRTLECNNKALEDNAKSNNEIARAVESQTRVLDSHSDALQTLLYGIRRKKTNLGRLSRSEEGPRRTT